MVQCNIGDVLYSKAHNEYIVPACIFDKLNILNDPEAISQTRQVPVQTVSKTRANHEDLRCEVEKVRKYLWEKLGCPTLLQSSPIFTPSDIEKLCRNAGAPNLFSHILHLMAMPEQSSNVKLKNHSRVVNVLHMLMFGQSQKCSWFQHANTSFLQKNGVSETGLIALWQEGITVHPRTARVMARVLDFNYESLVQGWIEDAVYRSFLLAFMVDDYTNVHTMHRPTGDLPSVVSKKATLLLKRFDDTSAIPVDPLKPAHNPAGVDSQLLLALLIEKMPNLSRSFVESMPSWIKNRFFDPEEERNRLALHDYQV